MERIENTKEHVTTTTEITWKAIDGTMFHDEASCKSYEETVEAVLLARLNDIEINKIDTDDLFESGGEGIYRVVVPKKEKDIDTLNQLWTLYGGKGKEVMKFNKEDIGTIVFVGIRYVDSSIDWLWFYKPAKVLQYCVGDKYKVSFTKVEETV